jgi:hypothetical protein
VEPKLLTFFLLRTSTSTSTSTTLALPFSKVELQLQLTTFQKSGAKYLAPPFSKVEKGGRNKIEILFLHSWIRN